MAPAAVCVGQSRSLACQYFDEAAEAAVDWSGAVVAVEVCWDYRGRAR